MKYEGVPAAEVAKLERFRAEHPYRRAAIQGVEWEYIACGPEAENGDRAILLLPGALATGESTWITLPHFEPRFRVIAPSYPPVPTMTELVDGLADVLTREGIDQAVVSGGSYGGLVAQSFVRRHPERTERLILSHTTVLASADARRLGTAVRLLRFLPERLVLAMFRGKIAGLVPELPETALFRAYVGEAVSGMTKAGLLALYARVADMQGGAGFTPQDLDGWPGRVLLVYADDDPATPAAAQRKLDELYPRAEVYVFSGTGHATALLQPEKYLGLLDRFIG